MSNGETTTNANVETSAKGNQKAKPSPKTAKATNGSAALTHLSPITEGDKLPRSMEYLGNKKMRVFGSVRFNEKSNERYRLNSVYDFSKCTEAEILELASANVRITIQGRVRTMGESSLKTKPFANVDVKSEVVETQKTAVDDVTKATRSFARLLGIPEADARKMVEAELAKKSKNTR